MRHQGRRDLTVDVRLPRLFAAERVEDPKDGRRRARRVPADGSCLRLREGECAGQEAGAVLGLLPLGLKPDYECIRRIHGALLVDSWVGVLRRLGSAVTI